MASRLAVKDSDCSRVRGTESEPGGRNRKEQGDPMTLQMETNRPRRPAEHTPRQPPDPVSYWLIAEKRNNRLEALTIIRAYDEQETLPVFSSEEEAELFFGFRGVTGGWR